MRIVATGKLFGKKLEVVFVDGKFLTPYDPWLEFLLSKPLALGGTYYPSKYEPLNVYYTLKDRYFDKLESITVEGDLGEIPQPAGTDVIY